VKVKVPTLSLIAGPNGSGKTYFTSYFLEKGFITTKPINLDFIGEEVYERLTANVYAYEQQIPKIKKKLFLKNCIDAINNEKDFAYECNLRLQQMQAIKLFDDAKYNLNLWYFYMPNINRCKERVELRVLNRGHDVDDLSIKVNFEEGLKNLDLTFEEWNQLFIIDNSIDFIDEQSDLGINILLIASKGKVLYCSDKFPKPNNSVYLKKIGLKCEEWKRDNKNS
jgi:predicted ABC-type ATPase